MSPASEAYIVSNAPNPFMVFEEPEKEPVLLSAPRLGPETDAQHQMRVTAYRAMDTPWGFANMLAQEDPDIELRVFLLDNSGSTSQADGHVLEKNHSGQQQAVPASRWDEICSMALAQAEWNSRAGVRSEFLLLNPPCPNEPVDGRDFVIIDPKVGSSQAQVDVLANVLRSNGPRGVTPLASRLQQLRRRLKGEVKAGRRIMLSIVTDGLPTSPDCGSCTQRDRDLFVQELRVFTATFNSFVVIRLATDEESTMEYYNKIDEELELPLDILDDLRGEAQEVYDCGNGWFAYTPLIHRIREGGTLEKLFDLLDERALKLPEIAKFLEFLFRKPQGAPFPRIPKELYQIAKEAVADTPLVYNGRLDRMSPQVDLKLLKKALGLNSAARLRSLPGRIFRAMTPSIFHD